MNYKTIFLMLLSGIVFSSYSMKMPTLAALCCKQLAKEWSQIDDFDEEVQENLRTFDELVPKNKEILTQELYSYTKPLHLCTIAKRGNFWRRLRFSPDGSKIVVTDPKYIGVYDAHTGKNVYDIPIINLGRFKWSKTGKYLLISAIFHPTELYHQHIRSSADGKLLYKFPKLESSTAFTADDKNLLRELQYEKATIHDAATGNVRASLGYSIGVNLPYQDPMGQWIMIPEYMGTEIYDAITLEKIHYFAHSFKRFSPDGRYFFLEFDADERNDSDNDTVECYTRDFKLYSTFTYKNLFDYRDISISNERILFSNPDGQVVFDVKTGKIISEIRHKDCHVAPKALHVGPDFSLQLMLEYGDSGKQTKVYVKSGNTIQQQWIIDASITHVYFTGDPHWLLLSGQDVSFALVNITSGHLCPIKNFTGNDSFKRSRKTSCVSSDGKYMHKRQIANNEYLTEIWQLPLFNEKNKSLESIMMHLAAYNKSKNAVNVKEAI